ncbi:MAG TPA: hypothetical protein VK661_13305 [Planctomycetota bacterium]|nr:hypothetical protein [Planctomycetota bacterium]
MRNSTIGLGLILALLPGSRPVEAQEKQTPYRFTKGETAKYEVTGALEISLRGSHPDFIKDGNETPLKMGYRALFENVVMETDGSNGGAQLERRARSVSATGVLYAAPFKYEWDREKDGNKPIDTDARPGGMIDLFRSWCTKAWKFGVDSEGKVSSPEDDCDRLLMKAGMMYWPVKQGEASWVSEDKIAVPVLHDKIIMEFKNEPARNVTRDGRKLVAIKATPKFKKLEKANPAIPGALPGDFEVTVAGEGTIEMDTTNRRLHSVKLRLTIRVSGKSPIPAGGDGDVRAEAVFVESQTYKD